MYWLWPTSFCLSYLLWYISEIKKQKKALQGTEALKKVADILVAVFIGT